MKFSFVFLLITSFFFISCASSDKGGGAGTGKELPANELELMVWNVENLFDTSHDKDKNDWAYLPLGTPGKAEACEKVTYWRYRKECFETDWNEERLAIKLDQIHEVIWRDRFRMPNFLALVEVENKNVVQKLAKRLGYKKFVMSEGPDYRGIDLALLYRGEGIKVISTHQIPVVSKVLAKKKRTTRDQFEVQLQLKNGELLTIIINHWPSLGNDTETRIAAATAVRERIKYLQKKHPKMHFVVTGDFNTIDSNTPHPFNDALKKGLELEDMHDIYKADRSISWDEKNKQPPGTYFYDKEMVWNRLDRIFVSKNLLDSNGLEADVKSYHIYAPEFMTKPFRYRKAGTYLYGSVIRGTPRRYYHNANSHGGAGYSDHFPIVMRLKF